MANAIVTPYADSLHRAQVIALWEAVFGYQSAHNNPSLAIDKKLAVKDGLFFIALSDETVVGTIMAGYDGHRGWIYSVAVSPHHQRQGIGTQLMITAEAALRDRGCLKINLQVMPNNEKVTAFYQALGYDIEERISMGKKLEENIPPT
ncbi:MAG TPA: GNAT family acetyltransferase [Verrucomicrobiae bacterium]